MFIYGRTALPWIIEVGIQNASMAILIAVSFLNRPDFAVTAGVYGITIYIGAGLLIAMAKRFHKPSINLIQQVNSEK